MKEVNHIFFNGYRDREQLLQQTFRSAQAVLLAVLGLVALVMLCALTTGSYRGMVQQAIELLGLAGILLLSSSELYLTCRKYFVRPRDQTEIEKTWSDISAYFRDLNEQTRRDAQICHKFEWHAPQDLLYLEVRFVEKVPMLDDEPA